MQIQILGAESLGVRSLCTLVTAGTRRILIDPGVALGLRRHGRLPHPVQVAVGRQVRQAILAALPGAADIVFSHFHGDHVPLADANPYQLGLDEVTQLHPGAALWCPDTTTASPAMQARHAALAQRLGPRLQTADGQDRGALAFSPLVPHGQPGSPGGQVMMTRIQHGRDIFVHASDIQLLDDRTVDRILDWRPDTVLVGGPPLYLRQRLDAALRERAWRNARRLAEAVPTLILDHHLLRSAEGPRWLAELSEAAGKPVPCAADFMDRPRLLLEAQRDRLYRKLPVAADWHERYAAGRADTDQFLDPATLAPFAS